MQFFNFSANSGLETRQILAGGGGGGGRNFEK